MIRINLLPVRAAQKKEKFRAQLSILILCLIAISVACGAEWFMKQSQIDEAKSEISSIQQQINQLNRQIGEVSRYKQLQADLKKKLEILQVLKDSRSGPIHLLDELNKALPDKVWLTSYSVNGNSVSLEGLAVDENAVASFMERLVASPYYGKVELGGISQQTANQIKLHKFVLTCEALRPAI